MYLPAMKVWGSTGPAVTPQATHRQRRWTKTSQENGSAFGAIHIQATEL